MGFDEHRRQKPTEASLPESCEEFVHRNVPLDGLQNEDKGAHLDSGVCRGKAPGEAGGCELTDEIRETIAIERAAKKTKSIIAHLRVLSTIPCSSGSIIFAPASALNEITPYPTSEFPTFPADTAPFPQNRLRAPFQTLKAF